MKGAIKKQAMLEVPGIIAKFLELPERRVKVVLPQGTNGPDFVVKTPGCNFLVLFTGTGTKPLLLAAWGRILESKAFFQKKDGIPLIVAPYMGESGANFCRDHDLSWIDLSGNVHIKAPGLLVHVEGNTNRFKRAGRPANVFSPKGARIARQLLMEPDKDYTQRELSRITGLDEGYTSRIVCRLEELNLISRDDKRALRSFDPAQLLDAWLEVYDFSRHQIIKGHIAARSGEELMKRISQTLAEQQIDYAATGLAGAWQYTHFARFRLATFFLTDHPGKDVFDLLHFREEDRGANTWLVVPSDKDVFRGASIQAGIPCVHPVQVYLDLKGHPERSKEAASALRRNALKWGGYA